MAGWNGSGYPVARCCSRCARGTRAFGVLPCGYPYGCPNALCAHYVMKTDTAEAEAGENQ